MPPAPSSAQSTNTVLKTPKGTRDCSSEQLSLRSHVISCVRQCCLAHDAEEIDTPDFELRDILSNKYGEDQKLIYNLEDFEGEMLSLRYDLTVPFARYLAGNRILSMRRFQAGKVFRRDNPKMNRGRLREFYQCDFDIAGKFSPMVVDAEMIFLAVRVMEALHMPHYKIKINHRNMLQGILVACGVKDNQIKTVCSSLDKLDKRPWDEIRNELIEQKSISSEVVDGISAYILDDSSNHYDRLRSDAGLQKSKLFKRGLDDMDALFKNLESLGLKDSEKIRFDCSLARGLDYYTGLIYEVVLEDFEIGGSDGGSVGTVAAGGRYDGLVKKISGDSLDVPCIGISFGIERIVTVLAQKLLELRDKRLFRSAETEVYVATAQSGFLKERLELVRLLLEAGVKVAYSAKTRPKFLDQIQYCEQKNIPFCLIIGQSEIEQNVVKLKDVATRAETMIKRDELQREIRRLVEEARDETNREMIRHGFCVLDRFWKNHFVEK